MREWLAKLTPAPWLSKRLLMIAVLAGVGIGAYSWGRHYASANPPATDLPKYDGSGSTPQGARNRIVGTVYGQPVYREELGEYLIARFGASRVEFLLNRKIVEQNRMCGICKEAFTSYNDIVPDHRNPKGMGGAWRDDHPDNIQAAHWWCNGEKGSSRI